MSAESAERARGIVNAVFRCVEVLGSAQIIFNDVQAVALVESALAAQAGEIAELQREVAYWKMHAYDHGYQP